MKQENHKDGSAANIIRAMICLYKRRKGSDYFKS